LLIVIKRYETVYFIFTLFLTSLALSTQPQKLVSAALERTKHFVIYNPAYFALEYPNGDVPEKYGVCTDVIIRSYRSLGIDLQKLVHEDMMINFDKYPSKRIWGLTKTDRNIDHRRVPNLRVFFSRFGQSLNVSSNPNDYRPGDIVTWSISGRPHIGIVTDQVHAKTKNPMIVHNIGWGPKLDDMLFDYPITGHYRY